MWMPINEFKCTARCAVAIHRCSDCFRSRGPSPPSQVARFLAHARPQGLVFHHTLGTDVLAPLWGLRDLRSLSLYLCADLVARVVLPLIAENLPLLQDLDIGGMHTDTASVAHLSKLPNIEVLRMYNNSGLRASGIRHLVRLKHLRELDLRFCTQLGDAGAVVLGDMVGLQRLDVTGCNMSDVGLDYLAQLSELRWLDLHHNSVSFSAEGLARVAAGAPKLEGLGLAFCSGALDPGFEQIGLLTELKRLNLHSCRELTQAGLEHLGGLKQLQSLRLGFCPNVKGDEWLAHLPSLRQLQELDLTFCLSLTDRGLIDVAKV